VPALELSTERWIGTSDDSEKYSSKLRNADLRRPIPQACQASCIKEPSSYSAMIRGSPSICSASSGP
jgi:hypothetical protein